jgi:hypothetical protein
MAARKRDGWAVYHLLSQNEHGVPGSHYGLRSSAQTDVRAEAKPKQKGAIKRNRLLVVRSI